MLGTTPPHQPHHDAINRYEEEIGGIPDCFDSMTAQAIRDIVADTAGIAGKTEAEAADGFIRAHLDMLDRWRDQLDALDSEIRGDVVEGSIPDWAATYLKQEARELFAATQDLLHAIAEYHHGVAGPRLNPDYGYAYALSNSTISPF